MADKLAKIGLKPKEYLKPHSKVPENSIRSREKDKLRPKCGRVPPEKATKRLSLLKNS